MDFKKLFFPLGGGDELEERIYGALLIAKTLNIDLEILKCVLNSGNNIYKELGIPKHIIKEIGTVISAKFEAEKKEFEILVRKIEKENFSSKDTNIFINTKEGYRSDLVELESKFCDLIIAAAPPKGISTATFETAVLKSGKAVLMFPRIMKNFKTENIIIGWNNSPQASRALTSSIPILKEAQKVHLLTSYEYCKNEEEIQKLLSYLAHHDIKATFEITKTTNIPGQTLLNRALDGNYDLIVAGAYGKRGIKELMFGGATRYLLEHSILPVFMSH